MILKSRKEEKNPLQNVLKNKVYSNFFFFFFCVVKNENFDGILVLHTGSQLQLHSILHMMEEMAVSRFVFQCRLVSGVLLCYCSLCTSVKTLLCESWCADLSNSSVFTFRFDLSCGQYPSANLLVFKLLFLTPFLPLDHNGFQDP